MDRHVVAVISICGSLLDCLGGVYLAYDLLGGKNGPLRTLTRAVTYAVLFGVCFGAILGLAFGVWVGLTHGVTLAIELARSARGRSTPGLLFDLIASGVRAIGYGVPTAFLFGWRFGLVFAVLSIIGQTIAYRLGIRPTTDLEVARPRITKKQAVAAVIRSLGYTAAGYVSGVVAHQRFSALGFAIKLGLTLGGVTAGSHFATPYIEWLAEHLPARRLGVFGLFLILIGFSLQSTQYWLTVFDVPVR
jgi:hypothetical protein